MPDRVVALIPVLNRPHRVGPLIENFRGAYNSCVTDILFLVCQDDELERDALLRANADFLVCPWDMGTPGDYAKKINFGIQCIPSTWWLHGADDLRFTHGWADEAMRVFEKTGATVIGTNDLGNPTVTQGEHSCHNLIHVLYAASKTEVLHEGYHHNWVDTELVACARYGGVWAFAEKSVIEHLHPVWGKGTWDRTYRAGQEHYHEDALLFKSRSQLWGGLE